MNPNITELGKLLRKMRVDSGETLGDMAEKLNITSSYLSAIEKGKRPSPDGLVEQITLIYSLDSVAYEELANAADKTIRSIKMNLTGSTDSQRDVALCFARSFESLDDETAQSVINLLNKKRDS